ncbi:hypothetical protein BH24ACT3_BH24ACT3_13990 [soil metagenome]
MRAAFATGVRPEPEDRPGVAVHNYNGDSDREIIERLEAMIGTDPFDVHIAQTFLLDQVADAHRALRSVGVAPDAVKFSGTAARTGRRRG